MAFSNSLWGTVIRMYVLYLIRQVRTLSINQSINLLQNQSINLFIINNHQGDYKN